MKDDFNDMTISILNGQHTILVSLLSSGVTKFHLKSHFHYDPTFLKSGKEVWKSHFKYQSLLST